MDTTKTKQEYRAISNCPKCHGALFYFKDPLLFHNKEIIKCYNCGSIFLKIREIINGGVITIVEPITPLRDRFKVNALITEGE